MKAFITILIILAAGALYYVLAPESWRFWEGQTVTIPNGGAAAVISQDGSAVHDAIAVNHQYKDGKHIIAGTVDLPSPCYTFGTKTTVAESFPEQVTIAFTSTLDTSKICAQVITPTQFKVEFAASVNASIKATWNGQPVTLNLTEVPAYEETEFEIFKG